VRVQLFNLLVLSCWLHAQRRFSPSASSHSTVQFPCDRLSFSLLFFCRTVLVADPDLRFAHKATLLAAVKAPSWFFSFSGEPLAPLHHFSARNPKHLSVFLACPAAGALRRRFLSPQATGFWFQLGFFPSLLSRAGIFGKGLQFRSCPRFVKSRSSAVCRSKFDFGLIRFPQFVVPDLGEVSCMIEAGSFLSHRIKKLEDLWFKLLFYGDFLNVATRCSMKFLWGYKLLFDLILIVDLARILAGSDSCFRYGF
jgi:hypothetical protein